MNYSNVPKGVLSLTELSWLFSNSNQHPAAIASIKDDPGKLACLDRRCTYFVCRRVDIILDMYTYVCMHV